MEKTFEWFIDEFEKLQKQALEHGISTVVLMDELDMFAKESRFAVSWVGYKSTSVGMLERARHRLLDED